MDKDIRNRITSELITLIEKGNAHVSFDEAVSGLPADLRTVTPHGLPYNIWQLLEHIRITQWDIVEFCLSSQHESPKWPEGYWPEEYPEKVDDLTWEASVNQIREDRSRFFDLLKDPEKNLLEAFAYGDGQNLVREALLIADHTSYHTGEIIVLRRLLNTWN